jgi:preprotein translocase subunit YajC
MFVKTSQLFLSALTLAGGAAAAQQPAPGAGAASFAAGAKVTDTAGGEVGTIQREDGAFVILKTDKHEVRLPKTSFTAHNGGFVMGMTQAQVNAAVEEALAEANAKIAAGASVTGTGGASVGTIESVDGEFVTLKLNSGKLVRLPRSGVAPGPNGAVIGMTAAELEAAAAQASGGATPEADAKKE